MTHNLHRQGTRENLSNDFTVFLVPARGYNYDGAGPKKRRFWEIAFRNNVVNAGTNDIGGNLITLSPQELLNRIMEGKNMAACVCTSKKDVVNILKESLAEDFGISLVVQGIREEVEDCLRQVGLKPHAVNHSLGFWGRTDKLPDREVLEITTMCGHGMISTNLAKKCIEDVTSGRMTPREVARLLARPCVCGIFNTSRAEALLGRIALRAR